MDTTSVQIQHPEEYRNKILFLPALGSTPETGFLFGAVVVPQFKFGSAGPETRSSSILFSGIYTLKNQILISILPDIILPEESWIFDGTYNVNYFPQNYWGIGPQTTTDDELLAIYSEIHIEQAVLRQVRPSLFFGPYIKWTKIFDTKFENPDGDRVPLPDIAGASGSTTAGAGLMIRFDQRASNMTPTDNHFLELSFLANPSWLGSTDPYASWKLDARKYLNLSGDGRSVLAFQTRMRFTSGTPSFSEMSMLGGDQINRGYYQGRFRDQNAAEVQAELRQNVFGRFGFTLFTATGEVWDRFADFSMANFKWTAGAGFRFNINKDDPTNIRVDVGFGKDTGGFYLQFGEAF